MYSASASPSISPSPSPELTGSVYVDKKDEDGIDWTGIIILLIKDGVEIYRGSTPALFEELSKGTYIVKELIPEGYEATGSTEYEFTVKDTHLFHNFTFSPFLLPDPKFQRNYQIVQGKGKVTKVANRNLTPVKARNVIPSWNVPGRPKNPKTGLIGFNFQTNKLEVWDGKRWQKLRMKKV